MSSPFSLGGISLLGKVIGSNKNKSSAVTQPSTTTQGVVGASPSGPQGGY